MTDQGGARAGAPAGPPGGAPSGSGGGVRGGSRGGVRGRFRGRFRVPLIAKLGVLIVATTGFYTYVGQLVPQKEVQPPVDVELKKDMSTAEMAKVGREIMEGKGLCFTCHTIGKKGALRFPDLEGVDTRARTREPGFTDVDYFAQAMYEPNAYIVPGFNPGMPVINKPPIGLTDDEILCVIAYLQSLGGTSTVTMQTKHHYNGGAAKP